MSGLSTPVNIVTGFLGSGKTTLLQRAVSSPVLRNAAVIMNEFGDIGLDHMLVERIDEHMVLLRSGCLCCTVREDLGKALRDLQARRADGKVPWFDRVVIETTGLADPVPVVATLVQDPMLRHQFRPANIIVTIDAVHALQQLADAPEAGQQVAVADRIVLTKLDIVEKGRRGAVLEAVRRFNKAAPAVEASHEDAVALFAQDAFDPVTRHEEVSAWLRGPDEADHHHHDHHHDHGDHGPHQGAQTFAISTDAPVDWALFGIWLSMLLHRHGDRVLRVKGILAVEGSDTPVVVNGVQHLIHPPVHLDRWPEGKRCSKLVFITRGMDIEAIRRSMAVFGGVAASWGRGIRPGTSA